MKSPMGRLDVQVGPHFQDKLAELVKQLKPKIMVETGLETGFGAEYYLQAMDEVGVGHLYSIDPQPHWKFTANPIVHPRFTLIKKRSQDALEDLFKEIGQFDVFLHDSDHGPECQKFEYDCAWRMVRSGGIIASDDPWWGMPPHRTWIDFCKSHGVEQPFIIGNAMYFIKP